MKKHIVTAIAFLATTTAALAQNKDTVAPAKPAVTPAPKVTSAPAQPKKDWSKVILDRRANDHFMVQLGYDNWANHPDSIHISGFNRSFNFYFMFDFPFKTDPRLSIGAGLGIGTSNIYLSKQEALVGSITNTTLAFPDESGGNHFKKNKVQTTKLEVPVELRFALDPENTNKSWKFAVGAKVGLLMAAHYKGKTYQNNVGQTIGNYTQKISSKQYFNGTSLAMTGRISYGVFGVFGQFQITSLLKSSAGAQMYPFSFGIMLSGL